MDKNYVYIGHLQFWINKPQNYFNDSPPVSVHPLEQFREPKVIHRMFTHHWLFIVHQKKQYNSANQYFLIDVPG